LTIHQQKPIIEDINKDGKINILDINELSKYYNIKKDNLGWIAEYDMNGDGVIDIFDLVIVSKKIIK
jgi:hypothetical protein